MRSSYYEFSADMFSLTSATVNEPTSTRRAPTYETTYVTSMFETQPLLEQRQMIDTSRLTLTPTNQTVSVMPGTIPEVGARAPLAPIIGGSSGSSSPTTAQVAQACAAAGGSYQAAQNACLFPDGALIAPGGKCLNQNGRCVGAPGAPSAGSSSRAGLALGVGAAALAALMFLR